MNKCLKIIAIILILAVIIFLAFYLIKAKKEKISSDMTASLNSTSTINSPQATSSKEVSEIKHLEILSSAFENNGLTPEKYTCDGDDIIPPLTIQNIPTSTKSLALIVDDPDAPRVNWTHWLVWNLIPAGNTIEIQEGIVPDGAVQGLNSFNRRIYKGPCPPMGTHHYYFRIYALDVELVLSVSSDKKALDRAMAGHILEQAELIGLYR